MLYEIVPAILRTTIYLSFANAFGGERSLDVFNDLHVDGRSTQNAGNNKKRTQREEYMVP